MLTIGLGVSSGSISLKCEQGEEDRLRSVAIRYANAVFLAPSAFTVSVEAFLDDLEALTLWGGNDVFWDDSVLRLVRTNLSDTAQLQSQIDSRVSSDVDEATLTDISMNLTFSQKRDVSKLLGLNHGANFSVPGAGKTRATMALFAIRRRGNPSMKMLVIAPKSAFESWKSETSEVVTDIPTVKLFSESRDADILLINYERLPGSEALLADFLQANDVMMVLDEAHRVKLGESGAWGASALRLAPMAKHRLILSGTPAPNSAVDLENLFSFVWPGQGKTRVRRAISGKSLGEASKELAPLFTRTTKSELGLPELSIVKREVPLSPLHSEIYEELIGLNRSRFTGPVDGGFDPTQVGRVTMYLLMAATSPSLIALGSEKYDPLQFKVPPLEVTGNESLAHMLRNLGHYEMSGKYKEIIAIILENSKKGRKTIVWSTFIRNLRTLEKLLSAFGPVLVHGGTEDRQQLIDRFRYDADSMVLLSNPATLGEGISLHQVCHDAIYVDRDFSAGRFLQSLDRIHRLGLPPDTETRVTCLISPKTIDEVVELRLEKKIKFLGGILDDPDVSILGDLEEEAAEGDGFNYQDLQAVLGHIDDHRNQFEH